jgi:hypothetical protein
MNSFSLNGASINGSSAVVIVQAEANIIASASVTAGATYIHEALAAGSGVAYVTVNPTRTTYGSAGISGEGNVYAAQTHIHAAGSADVSGSAEIVAYVTRVISGEAMLGGVASFFAIPASLLGSSNITAGANLSATATRVYHGGSSAVATANIVANGQCFRMVSAQISGQAELRAEGVKNGVHDGFCNVVSTAEIAPFDSGIVIRQMGADIDCSAMCSASATLELFGSAPMATGAEVSADAVVVLTGVAESVTASASMSSVATRTVLPSAGIIAGCIISVVSAQIHAATASPSGSAEIIPISTVCVPAHAAVSASADVGVGIVTSTQHGVAAFSCTATLLAEGRSNADAIDPEERTARRPLVDTAMRRPFTETSIRRAA